MIDITMCVNKKCPLNSGCYRFMAIPHEYRQSWAGFEYNKEKNKCDHFVETEGRRIRKNKEFE